MLLIWAGFIGFVLVMLALDLGVFHRKAHAVSVREAMTWSAVWIALGLAFTGFIYYGYEHHWLGNTVDAVDGAVNDGSLAAVKYLTGYVVEKSLSVDNIFVIAMVFAFFGVPAMYQHRVLFWGVLGALVMRAVMIAVGAKLIAEFHWILYVFGAFLIITAAKMLLMKTEHSDPNLNMVVRLTRRLFPVTESFHGEHFVVRAGTAASREAAVPGAELVRDTAVELAQPGTLMLTPLALALILVETTDLIFAVDSIPAIFAITTDPFLVFTSNVFAVLGLRSLYFALAGLIRQFRYLKVSLAVVLAVVGGKMLVGGWLKETVPAIKDGFHFYVLLVIGIVLAVGVLASLLAPRDETAAPPLGDRAGGECH